MGNEESYGFNKDTPYCERSILSIIREGDYAHAGEIEAIDIMLSNFPEGEKERKRMIDVGCGLGATADYLRKKSFASEVWAFDRDFGGIEYAKYAYPDVKFFVCDVLKLSDHMIMKDSEKFDVITLWNVFYCITDKNLCLKQLHEISDVGTTMMIFEYTNKKTENPSENRLYRKDKYSCFEPIDVTKIEAQLEQNGWKVEKMIDMSEKYEEWYKNFLANMDKKKEILVEKFTHGGFLSTRLCYENILKSIQANETGGTMIFCRSSKK